MTGIDVVDTHVCQRLSQRVFQAIHGDTTLFERVSSQHLMRDLYGMDMTGLMRHVQDILDTCVNHYPGVNWVYGTAPATVRDWLSNRAVHTTYAVEPWALNYHFYGLMAYRFTAYDILPLQREMLLHRYGSYLTDWMAERIVGAIVIITIAQELDAAYFQGTAATEATLSTAATFTAVVDWFIDFLTRYGALGQ